MSFSTSSTIIPALLVLWMIYLFHQHAPRRIVPIKRITRQHLQMATGNRQSTYHLFP